MTVHRTWFAIKELQAVELYFKAVICPRHDVFDVAGARRQQGQVFPAQAGHLVNNKVELNLCMKTSTAKL